MRTKPIKIEKDLPSDKIQKIFETDPSFILQKIRKETNADKT